MAIRSFSKCLSLSLSVPRSTCACPIIWGKNIYQVVATPHTGGSGLPLHNELWFDDLFWRSYPRLLERYVHIGVDHRPSEKGPHGVPLPTHELADDDLIQAIDALLEQNFKPDEPGAAAIVARGGQALYHKGWGLADLELRIPLRPEMVLRIASLTKQFTALVWEE